LGFFLVLVVAQVYGWGEEGHQIVGQLAQQLLSSTATNVADQFLGDHTLEQIAPWPDSYAHTPQVYLIIKIIV
jgi:hypothetical protein